jgi:hypothetical protein
MTLAIRANCKCRFQVHAHIIRSLDSSNRW